MQAKLEEELRIRDLDASGNKQELVERLHAALTVFLVCASTCISVNFLGFHDQCYCCTDPER